MGEQRTSQVALLERESELAVLGQVMDDVADGRGAVALIEGASGLGKTTLLRAATGLARERGYTVLSALGQAMGDDLPWLTVRELLEPALRDDRGMLLSGAAGMSSAVLDPSTAPQRNPEMSATAMHGLYWLVANLAERGPLVLAIDDLQLVDQASLRWLIYLGRRLSGLRVLLIATAPPGTSLLVACEPQVLSLRPLTDEAARAMVGDSADPEFADACVAVAQGNPFLLRELLGELERNEVLPLRENAAAAAGTLPANVSRAVLLRVTRSGEHAVGVARAVAILGTEASVRNVAQLSGLGEDDVVAGVSELEAAEVLARELPLRFVHPLARSAVYESVTPAERTRWHRKAAALLARRGSDPAVVAGQLLACEPAGDPVSVRLLQDAAAGALRTGAPDSAVRFLRRAREELSPNGDDAGLLRELGSAEASAGDPQATEHLERALELETAPRLRAETALALGSVLTRSGRSREAVTVLDRAIHELGASESELRLRLEAEAIAAAREDFELRRLIPDRIERLAGLEGSSAAELVLLANMAMESAATGSPPATETVALAERALARGRLVDEETADSPACYLAIHSLVAADRTDLAAKHLDHAFADARERGSLLGTAIASICGSHASYRTGDLAAAVTHARTALEIADAAGWAGMMPWGVAFLVDALVEAGQIEEAVAQLAASGLDGELPALPFFEPLAGARARLALARRDPEEALRMARHGELLANCGSANPAMSSWRSETSAALAALGRADEARALADEQLALARAYGAAQPIAAALRALARLSDPDERLDHLRESVALLESSPARLDHAKSVAELGVALRLSGERREAREPLRLALEVATDRGAHALAHPAGGLLVAGGGRPRRPALKGVDALTPAEQRVARMAADGMTNREIAQTLFVTVRTVELHLTHAYQKLGISSRAKLGPALGS
jgi:DNA-binding NarL/FixJ family response regulator